MLFTLTKNQLYAKAGDPRYVARARATKRMTKEQIIEKIAFGNTLSEVDVGAVLTSLEKALVEYVALGCTIDLGFITLRYSIRGGFASDLEGFHKDRNWVKVQATVSDFFSEAVNKSAKPEKIAAETKAPTIFTINKVMGEMQSTDYKVGNLLRLGGTKLTFDQADPETGVFLQPVTGSAVRVSEYGKTCDTSIVLKIPDALTPGNIAVEVRTRSVSGKLMIGDMEEPLVIAA